MENSYLSTIQSKRQQKAATDVEDTRTNSIIEAVQGGNNQLSSAMHDMLMATLIGKDPKIAETAKNLSELLEAINKATKEVSDPKFENVGKKFDALAASMKDVPALISKTQAFDKLIPYLERFENTLRAKNFSPNVQVSQRLDLSELQTLLKDVRDSLKELKPEVEESSGIDLSAYRAQDIYDEEDTKVQYVGFVDQQGGWYIISNDLAENSMRYKFGKSKYEKAWSNREGQKYRLLNEAIDEA